MKRYESIPDILTALRKRRVQVSQEEVESAMEHLGLWVPLGPDDLTELIEYLGPEHVVNRRVIRTEKILSSKEWAGAVREIRSTVGLPSVGLTEDEARKLHMALLDTIFTGQVWLFSNNGRVFRSAPLFWKELIEGCRMLCTLLSIDGRPIDDIRAPCPNMLLGVRKILNPEGVLKVWGMECPYRPGQTDYLIAHVLWGHPLNPKIMEPKPSVSFQWKPMAGGGGRCLPYIFNQKQATAAELRELKTKMGEIQWVFRECALLTVVKVAYWRGLIWKERWIKWNQLYPDFAVRTPGAFRKECEYAVRNKEAIVARIDKLGQPPG